MLATPPQTGCGVSDGRCADWEGPERIDVSVVIPTFNRPEMLRRAVGSALSQRGVRFEVVVSSDDGELPAWLVELAERDGRVRAVVNPGRQGQVSNLNHGIAAARGEWIKPLYDDDELEPGCLAAMVEVGERLDVVLVRGLARHCVHGRVRRVDGSLGETRLDGAEALAAHYAQEIEIGVPSQVLVRRWAAMRAPMEEVEGVEVGVDWWWYVRLMAVGDIALLDRVVATEHQGHETVTSSRGVERMFWELRLLRKRLRREGLVAGRLPSERVIEGMDRVLEAACLVRGGNVLRGLRAAAGVWRPGAWWMAVSVVARRWRERRIGAGRRNRGGAEAKALARASAYGR